MIGIGQILSIGEKIIDKVIPDPTERAKAKAALLEQQQKGELQHIEASMSVIISEAKGGSWLQRSWRPLTMLTFVGLIVAKWLGMTAPGVTEAIELELLGIIKIGLGGYIMGRSAEKVVTKLKLK